jgi:hypothetical protein
MRPRSLKVEAEGDPWRSKLKPKLRLVGRWLEQMGFPPGGRVEVSPIEPGLLQIKLKPSVCAEATTPYGSPSQTGTQSPEPRVMSLDECIASLEQWEENRRTAFTKPWREHCKRRITEMEAYILEHYPPQHRSRKQLAPP